MILEISGEGRGTARDGCEVRGANVERGVVFEEEGPGGGVEFGCVGGRGYHRCGFHCFAIGGLSFFGG